MLSTTDPRLQRKAALVIAAGVAILLSLSAGRSIAAVTVANCSIQNVTVNGGTDSAPIALPASAGNPTLLTVTNRTPNDGILGILSIAINFFNVPPSTIVWTGTARGVLTGGTTTVANTNLGSIGVGITVVTDLNGATLNRFKIHNTSGTNSVINVHMVW